MNRAFLWSLIGSFCVLFGGCGTQAAQSDATEADSPVTAMSARSVNTRTLAEADVQGMHVRFVAHDTNQGSVVGIEESGFAYAKGSPVERLLSQKLTALEVFKAIVPNGEVPPELVDAQAAQAEQLGRQDSAVQEASFDAAAPVEKSVAACEDWVYAARASWVGWTNGRGIDWASGGRWLPVSNTSNTDWSFFTSHYVALGVCNESGTEATANIAFDNAQDGNNWGYGTPVTIAPHQYWRYWNVWSSMGVCTPSAGGCVGDCAAVGTLCIARQYGSRWAVYGAGSSFHLKTAEEYDILY